MNANYHHLRINSVTPPLHERSFPHGCHHYGVKSNGGYVHSVKVIAWHFTTTGCVEHDSFDRLPNKHRTTAIASGLEITFAPFSSWDEVTAHEAHA
jgi:hypothetical protein